MKIIIINNDETLRDELSGFLSLRGHQCVEALNTDQALEIMTYFDVDLVVTDYFILNMKGIELLKTIKNHYPQTRVFIMTANTKTEHIIGAINFGADGFFRKKRDNLKFAKKIREIEESSLDENMDLHVF